MTKNGTPLHVKDIAVVAQGPKIRLGQFARAIRREDGKIVDNDDVVSGIVLLRKGCGRRRGLQGIQAKVKELNEHILPRRRQDGSASSTAATWCISPPTPCCTT